MRRIDCIVVAVAVTVSLSFAKDHSNDYKMGTLTKVPLHVGGKVSMGYTDTTSCNSGLFGVHCTGGIVDDYGANLVADMPDGTEVVIKPCAGGASLAAAVLPCSQPYVLTLTKEDGTFVFLDHTWGHRDSAKELDTNSKVLYRTKHVRGLVSVDYVMIPDPTNPNKEGTYNVIKPMKPPTKKDAAAPAPDNIAATCASDKLSAELKAKYCKEGQ